MPSWLAILTLIYHLLVLGISRPLGMKDDPHTGQASDALLDDILGDLGGKSSAPQSTRCLPQEPSPSHCLVKCLWMTPVLLTTSWSVFGWPANLRTYLTASNFALCINWGAMSSSCNNADYKPTIWHSISQTCIEVLWNKVFLWYVANFNVTRELLKKSNVLSQQESNVMAISDHIEPLQGDHQWAFLLCAKRINSSSIFPPTEGPHRPKSQSIQKTSEEGKVT